MNKLTTEHTPDNIIASWLDDHQEELVHTADYIFHHPELAYQETLSSKCLADYLESQGFKITWKTAGIDTSFTAVWGSGKPLLGFLAEYDALAGVGHACGHNLLGTAVAAAACALKADMEATDAAGTIRVYGCPAEEIMSGKIVMNDQGVFNDLDVAITWHPFDRNRVSNDIWQAQDIKNYTFHGISSHAAKAPEKGRSALDAAELMNVASTISVSTYREMSACIMPTLITPSGKCCSGYREDKLFHPLLLTFPHRRCKRTCRQLRKRCRSYDRHHRRYRTGCKLQ